MATLEKPANVDPKSVSDPTPTFVPPGYRKTVHRPSDFLADRGRDQTAMRTAGGGKSPQPATRVDAKQGIRPAAAKGQSKDAHAASRRRGK